MSWWAKWVGKEFVTGGRGPEAYDCYGLVREVERLEFGIELPEYRAYDNAFDHEQTVPLFARGIEQVKSQIIERDDARDGDLVFMRYKGRVAHIGVFVEPNRVLHIDRGCNSVVEVIDSPMLRLRVEEIRRVD